MKKGLLVFCLWVMSALVSSRGEVPRFSTAGFFDLPSSGRSVYSMNPAWRFYKGSPGNGVPYSTKFDDTQWDGVNLPNGLELLPLEASGGINYRGVAWYRKHFSIPQTDINKRFVLHFEAVMGKSKIWVNDSLVSTHFGGFTPISIDITRFVKHDGQNLIAVMADNSDDPIYPPGKPQATLDFCYFGGIYRDVWMVTTSRELYVTDPNMVDKIAGGGFFAAYRDVSQSSAQIELKLDVDGSRAKGKIDYELVAPDGKVVSKLSKKIERGENISTFILKNPSLWSPESPNLYLFNIRLRNEKGQIIDGMTQRLGVRSVDFSFSKGLILNGKPYPRKLIGANRHQDFAVIGNALSNSLHYRDVCKLKNAGLEIIRNAHYPQDPAFMDACDELGLFVIVNTPGWQFWNKTPIFEQRVYSDIRTIVRRDRNHPSVLMWEPILNETYYPQEFAQNTHNIVKVETPYPGTNFTAADAEARGSKYFDIIFTHPKAAGRSTDQNQEVEKLDTNKVYFTREWGDNVDDWNSHNSTSRVARQWGETAQLIQAFHYAAPKYPYTSYELLQNQPAYHFGGTLWHSFDHQRGYHPDPFYGGIMDAFRRPKYSYYMFQAQAKGLTKPMVFIANELTPFSSKDVTVFSNCDSVRLTTFVGKDTLRMGVIKSGERWYTFDDAWDFMADKALSRSSKQSEAHIVAEGLNAQGQVVARHTRSQARRAVKLELVVDSMNIPFVADGGDLVVVTARMVDQLGNVKRLNNEYVRFSIEGQGEIVASQATATNPVAVLWGEASILVRSTTTAGSIKVRAEVLIQGDNTPLDGQVEFLSKPSSLPLIYDKDLKITISHGAFPTRSAIQDRQATQKALREVEDQQTAFGETPR